MNTLNASTEFLSELASYDVNREKASLKLSDPLANDVKLFSTEDLSDNVTVITKSVVVDGNIASESALSVKGKVNGSISTCSDIGVNGIVQGDVEARNASYNHAGIKGNTNVSEDLVIDNETVVIGDLDANAIIVNSKVKGEIFAKSKIDLRSSALVVGNITAGRINMEDGASANGSLTLVGNKSAAELDKEFNLEV